MMKKPVQYHLRSFLARHDGSITVESVILIPLVFTVFMIGFTFFDVFREKSLSLKANYAISDLISRDDNVTEADLQGYHKLFRYLTNNNPGAWIRVTEVKCLSACGKESRVLRKVWSKSYPAASVPELTTTDIQERYREAIPLMYLGEFLVIVETNVVYLPIFSGDWTGIFSRNMTDLVVTKPRNGPKICFENENCNP
ncbi:hypothetical protein SAMN04488527_11186 [Aliiroseovarius crassostreae]|uniref:Pilus assembly protein TadE n=2 Tax=Aliiroseovarius crassostreae TaxID=154981 RepID=A0A0P7KJ17_9RHOB|nr:hypothetical protein AKJ29_04790 [Aliiroseovarius crassostreae]SFU70256.1 hypothetical protein SAMN04488527_11186 [Aliiroseovarius crassostreae]